MAADRLNIDTATLFDNVDDRRVEFAADVGEERHAFAVPYDSLRALTGLDPITEPVATLHSVADQVAQAGAKALARDPDQVLVVISENDL